jgi:hypothetical protein
MTHKKVVNLICWVELFMAVSGFLIQRRALIVSFGWMMRASSVGNFCWKVKPNLLEPSQHFHRPRTTIKHRASSLIPLIVSFIVFSVIVIVNNTQLTRHSSGNNSGFCERRLSSKFFVVCPSSESNFNGDRNKSSTGCIRLSEKNTLQAGRMGLEFEMEFDISVIWFPLSVSNGTSISS